MLNDHVSEHTLQVFCNQSLGTQIAMLQCTIAGGLTKGANEKSFVFVHQHGRQIDSLFSKI